MVSKYEKSVWEILDFKQIKSTNEILEEVSKKANKIVHWNTIYSILKNLETDGKVERLPQRSGIFWRKK